MGFVGDFVESLRGVVQQTAVENERTGGKLTSVQCAQLKRSRRRSSALVVQMVVVGLVRLGGACVTQTDTVRSQLVVRRRRHVWVVGDSNRTQETPKERLVVELTLGTRNK